MSDDDSRQPRMRSSITIVTAIALLVVAVAAVAMRVLPAGQDEPESAEAMVTLEGTPLLAYAEFGQNADAVYLAPADDPGDRTLVDYVDHAPGWGLNPAPAMHRSTFAFTLLSPESPAQADAPAEVWLMDVETGERTRLARDADLQIAPRFVSGGEALLYRRSSSGEQEIVRIDLATSTRTVVHAERTRFGIFPIGYAADGGLVFARLSEAGTEVLGVYQNGAPSLLLHLSDDIARDWELAPDGRSLAYLAVDEMMERVLHRAYVAELTSGERRDLEQVEARPGEQYAPRWTGDGSMIAVGQQAAPGDPGAVVVQSLDGEAGTLSPPESGFDVPVAWSPDGRFLAVRSFSGTHSTAPGDESAVILDVEGERYPVTAQAEVIFIGWFTGA